MLRATTRHVAAGTTVLLVVLALSGCLGPQVYGTGPVKGCGTEARPMAAALAGTRVAWVGTEFVAGPDGAVVWVDGQEADLGDWWGQDIDGWAVLAIDPNATVPEAVAGSAGLRMHDGTYTTAKVAGTGPTVGDRGQVGSAERTQLIEPVALGPGEHLFLIAGSTHEVASISLQILWRDCGETGAIYGGLDAGGTIEWSDLEAPVLAANAAVGAVAYEASADATIGEGVVVARAPPAGSNTLYGEAALNTSRGDTVLAEDLRFFVHDGGSIRYDATYAGGPGSADGPLAVWFQVPVHEMWGPIQKESTTFRIDFDPDS